MSTNQNPIAARDAQNQSSQSAGPNQARTGGNGPVNSGIHNIGGNDPANHGVQQFGGTGPVTSKRRRKTSGDYTELRNRQAAQRPKIAQPNWAKFDRIGDGPLGIVSKKTGQLVNNHYMVEHLRSDPSSQVDQVWGGTFTHTAGVQAMMDMFVASHDPNMAHSVYVVIHKKGQQPTEFAGNRPLPKLVPHLQGVLTHEPRGKRQQTRDEMQCANCGKPGHSLQDCIGPWTSEGDIVGCPNCNTRGHSVDECFQMEDAPLEKWVDVLFFKRANKCIIRSNCEIWEAAAKLNEHKNMVFSKDNVLMPWSRQQAISVGRKKETMQKLQEFQYVNRGRNQGAGADPSLNWQMILEGRIPSSAWDKWRLHKQNMPAQQA